MVYATLFYIGLLGVAALLALGMGHGGGGGHHLVQSGHGHAADAYGHAHPHGAMGGRARFGSLLLSFLSPLSFLSICLGVGATGLILRHHLASHGEIAVMAAVGGLALNLLVIRPMMSFVFRFASKPSKALEGSTAQTVEAASHFDTTGKGVVLVHLDGQIVRVLATLEPEDQAGGGSIQPGEKLTVTAVDARANTCRVARI